MHNSIGDEKVAESLRLIAIYLPQYHPIPENDEWWGRGFTEWTNVVKAKPLFRGHHQPHVPSDLGFYDLRVAESREAQAQLAREHGIHGFCYFHYWFNGRRILQRPFNEVLASGKPNFPFCLLWANDSWEGRWHGLTSEKRTLIKQEYAEADDLNHIRWLAAAMADPRYIRVGNRPIFVIYRPMDLPSPERTIDCWKNEMSRLGMPEPYIIASDSHAFGRDLTVLGFDANLHYLPQFSVLDVFGDRTLATSIKRFFLNMCRGIISPQLLVFDYEASVKKMLWMPTGLTHRSMLVSWDNTPRAGRRGVVLNNGTPEKFERLLSDVCRKTQLALKSDRQLVFINAWNEWAEGNHLEPDSQHGRAYLEAVKRVVLSSKKESIEQETAVEHGFGHIDSASTASIVKQVYWKAYERLRSLQQL